MKFDIFAEWMEFDYTESRSMPVRMWYEFISTFEGTTKKAEDYCCKLDKGSPYSRDGTYNNETLLVSYQCAESGEHYLDYLVDKGFEVRNYKTGVYKVLNELFSDGVSRDELEKAINSIWG